MNQNQNAVGTQRIESGGVRLRDYTESGSSSGILKGIRRQMPEEGVRGALPKINIDSVARGLIFASLGLGVMEILMPGRVQKIAGVRKGNHHSLIRFLGFREVMSALMIWMQSRPNMGVWSRVAGDAMDLSLLGAAFGTRRVKKNRLVNTTAFIAGVTVLDVLTAMLLTRRREEGKMLSALTRDDIDGGQGNGAFLVKRSVTINRSPADIYNFWRNFENLPQFMYHLQSVRVIDERRSHWVAKAPAGTEVEWDAEIVEDVPTEMIAWQSIAGADVPNSGVVRFKPAPRGHGTEVHVQIEYRPPAGAIGRIVAKLFGEEPGQQVKGDLNRFKQVMETGEVVRSEGSPAGLGQKLQRPARPLSALGGQKERKGILGKLLPGKRYSEEEWMRSEDIARSGGEQSMSWTAEQRGEWNR